MAWYTPLTLLSLPPQSILLGPYSSLALPALSPTSFNPSTPLSTRLRHSDLVLYSLLLVLLPAETAKANLPFWPPLSQADAKVFRAELGKLVEAFIRAEKERGAEEKGSSRAAHVFWRRSYLDEALGEKWEAVLEFLVGEVLKRKVEGVNNLEG